MIYDYSLNRQTFASGSAQSEHVTFSYLQIFKMSLSFLKFGYLLHHKLYGKSFCWLPIALSTQPDSNGRGILILQCQCRTNSYYAIDHCHVTLSKLEDYF